MKKKLTKINYKFVLQELEYKESKKKNYKKRTTVEIKHYKFIYDTVLKEFIKIQTQNIMYKKIYNCVISELDKRDIYIQGILYKKFLASFDKDFVSLTKR